MNSEIILITHNDLDAVASTVCVLEAIKTPVKIFTTNYKNIKDVAHAVQEYAERNQIQTLLITDVSFSDNKDTLLELSKICPKFFWIDHHSYPDGFFDDLDFRYIYDVNKSAGLLTYEFFKLNQRKDESQRMKNLHDFIVRADAFDLWEPTSEYFKDGFRYNNFFSMNYDVVNFVNVLIQNDYQMPPSYNAWTEDYHNKCVKHIKKLEDNNLIYRQNNISIVFTDDYINELILKEHTKNLVVMIVNSYGLIRFRMSKLLPFDRELRKNIKDRITPVGHLNAYTIKINKGYDSIMGEIQRYANIIVEEFGKFENLREN